jgi:hypothetical protein
MLAAFHSHGRSLAPLLEVDAPIHIGSTVAIGRGVYVVRSIATRDGRLIDRLVQAAGRAVTIQLEPRSESNQPPAFRWPQEKEAA